MGWNLPPGCEVSDIPGWRLIDYQHDEAERVIENLNSSELIERLIDIFDGAQVIGEISSTIGSESETRIAEYILTSEFFMNKLIEDEFSLRFGY